MTVGRETSSIGRNVLYSDGRGVDLHTLRVRAVKKCESLGALMWRIGALDLFEGLVWDQVAKCQKPNPGLADDSTSVV